MMSILATRLNFKLATHVHRSLYNSGPQFLLSLLHPYTPTRHLRSASLSLLSQPRVNIALASRGFRHAGLASFWNSLPRHLCMIYRLLQCLQIQYKYSPVLWCKHLWPLTTLLLRF